LSLEQQSFKWGLNPDLIPPHFVLVQARAQISIGGSLFVFIDFEVSGSCSLLGVVDYHCLNFLFII